MIALLLLGCGARATCEVAPPTPILAGCAQDDRLGDTWDLPFVRLSFAGPVVDAGRGRPDTSCLDGPHTLGDALPEYTWPDLRWIQVEDAEQGGLFTAVVYAPDAPRPILTNEAVTVFFSRETDSEGRTEGELLIYDAAAALRLYIGQAGRVAGLRQPEGLRVAEGEALCTLRDDCDARRLHWLDVDLGASSVALLPGEETTLGGIWVQSGGVEVDPVAGSCGQGDRALVGFAE